MIISYNFDTAKAEYYHTEECTMKKTASLLLALVLVFSLSVFAFADDALPAPEADETSMFGVDANINVGTIDNYLGRDDVA